MQNGLQSAISRLFWSPKRTRSSTVANDVQTTKEPPLGLRKPSQTLNDARLCAMFNRLLRSEEAPRLPDLESISLAANSSEAFQDLLKSVTLNTSQELRNVLYILSHCTKYGSEPFRREIANNLLTLSGLLIIKSRSQTAEFSLLRELMQSIISIINPAAADSGHGIEIVIPAHGSTSWRVENACTQLRLSNGVNLLDRSTQSYLVFVAIVFGSSAPPKPTNIPSSEDEQSSSTSKEPFSAIHGYLRHIVDDPSLRRKTFSARGSDAQAIMFGLQSILDREDKLSTVLPPRETILRLLQDVASASGELPADYWLRGVSEHSRIRWGGEADIFRGLRLEGSVKIPLCLRKVRLEGTDDWTSPPGRRLLHVIRREVISHRQLRHPNILPFLGVYESTDHPMVTITPWIGNSDAKTYLDEHSDYPTLVVIILGLGDALSYLHTREPPVIHGDIHGGNVLIDENGRALLCDFGLSRIRHQITRSMTKIGEGGSLRHMAPELFSGLKKFRTSEASDIYSLAMTILEFATGSPPFSEEHENPFAAARAAEKGIRPGRPSQMRAFPPLIADGLWSMLEVMWAHQPPQRPSAVEVSEYLSPLWEQLLPPLAQDPKPASISSPSIAQGLARLKANTMHFKATPELIPSMNDMFSCIRSMQGCQTVFTLPIRVFYTDIRTIPGCLTGTITHLYRLKEIPSRYQFVLLKATTVGEHPLPFFIRLDQRSLKDERRRPFFSSSLNPDSMLAVATMETALIPTCETTHEAIVEFINPISLRRLGDVLEVFDKEMPAYGLLVPNCWFFTSVLQEVLTYTFGAKVQSGKTADTDLWPASKAGIFSQIRDLYGTKWLLDEDNG